MWFSRCEGQSERPGLSHTYEDSADGQNDANDVLLHIELILDHLRDDSQQRTHPITLVPVGIRFNSRQRFLHLYTTSCDLLEARTVLYCHCRDVKKTVTVNQFCCGFSKAAQTTGLSDPRKASLKIVKNAPLPSLQPILETPQWPYSAVPLRHWQSENKPSAAVLPPLRPSQERNLARSHPSGYCLVGLVVKVSSSGAEDPGFESRTRRDFSGSSHTSDLKIGTPVAALPGAWHYRVSAGTVRPGVSIL